MLFKGLINLNLLQINADKFSNKTPQNNALNTIWGNNFLIIILKKTYIWINRLINNQQLLVTDE